MKKNDKKTFTRKKSPEQQEAELIMEELEKERMLHALEVEEVPVRISLEINDDGNFINMISTSKTKFVMCTVDVQGCEIFEMIDDNIENLLKNAKECYNEYAKMRIKYIDRFMKITQKKNISDEICFKLDDIRDEYRDKDLKQMEELMNKLDEIDLEDLDFENLDLKDLL